MARYRLTTNRESRNNGGRDASATMSLGVRVVDANGAQIGPGGWMYITYAAAQADDGVFIHATSPPFVGHVIRGFTIILPPPTTKAGC